MSNTRVSTTKSSGERFPRSTDLPAQSPLFWVQQKDRYLRQLLIRDIEGITGRRLVVFFCNRFVPGAELLASDVARFAELLGDTFGKPIDLLIETPGGETDATESILALISQNNKIFRAIVPNSAKSNGSLLCLHASEIVMGPTSELGPIEPSLNGVPCSTLILPEVRNGNFPLHIAAQHALRQTQELARRALANGMMIDKESEEIEKAVAALSTRDTYPVHGSVIDRAEAIELGLRINSIDPGDELWDRVWLLHCMYDHDLRRDGLAKIFEGSSRSLAVSKSPVSTV
jgi:hypothetical protein